MLTLSDLRGPVGPFLLEVLLTNPRDPSERRWALQQSVRDADEGLRVASRMAACYQFRLYLGAEHGHLYLDWQDNDDETCSPVWVRK